MIVVVYWRSPLLLWLLPLNYAYYYLDNTNLSVASRLIVTHSYTFCIPLTITAILLQTTATIIYLIIFIELNSHIASSHRQSLVIYFYCQISDEDLRYAMQSCRGTRQTRQDRWYWCDEDWGWWSSMIFGQLTHHHYHLQPPITISCVCVHQVIFMWEMKNIFLPRRERCAYCLVQGFFLCRWNVWYFLINNKEHCVYNLRLWVLMPAYLPMYSSLEKI